MAKTSGSSAGLDTSAQGGAGRDSPRLAGAARRFRRGALSLRRNRTTSAVGQGTSPVPTRAPCARVSQRAAAPTPTVSGIGSAITRTAPSRVPSPHLIWGLSVTRAATFCVSMATRVGARSCGVERACGARKVFKGVERGCRARRHDLIAPVSSPKLASFYVHGSPLRSSPTKTLPSVSDGHAVLPSEPLVPAISSVAVASQSCR